MQEQRDQGQLIMDIAESGATPEQIQEAMAELMKANEGNTFWQQFMKPQPEALEYKPLAGEVERALNGLHPDTSSGGKKPELTKREVEMGKIKALDMQLAHMAKEQRKKKIEKSIRPTTTQS